MGFTEILEVLMVGIDLDWVLGSLHVHSPVFEALRHCKELFVVDRVLQLRGREFARVIAYRMEVVRAQCENCVLAFK